MKATTPGWFATVSRQKKRWYLDKHFVYYKGSSDYYYYLWSSL